MTCTIDSISMINIVLCAVIAVLGLFAYLKNKSRVALLIAIAFVFFGVSHIVAELGTTQSLCSLFTIRLIAYLIVVLALYGEIIKK